MIYKKHKGDGLVIATFVILALTTPFVIAQGVGAIGSWYEAHVANKAVKIQSSVSKDNTSTNTIQPAINKDNTSTNTTQQLTTQPIINSNK